MKLFRIVSKEFSSPDKILSGVGAMENGGRWSQKGTRAIYTSLDQKVAVAEKAFYSISTRAEEYIHQGRSPKYFFDMLVNQEFVLAEIEAESLSLLDLTCRGNLNQATTELNLGPFTTQDGRKSPYNSLPSRWTQEVGNYIYYEKEMHLKAMSARSDVANNVVIYPELEDSKGTYKVLNTQIITLSAVDSSGQKLRYRQKPALKKVLYERNGISAQVIDTLNF